MVCAHWSWRKPRSKAPRPDARSIYRAIVLMAVHVQEHVWITLSDGCRLGARLWLPAGAEREPVPAILEYIPYRKRDGTRSRDEPMHGHFAEHGYAAVRVDMRGSGESDCHLAADYLDHAQGDALEL